jgi:large subunit ribosomal protein L24
MAEKASEVPVKTKLRRDDQVVVVSGREKGKSGRILRIDRLRNRVVIEGVNMVKKAVRQRRQGEQSGIIEIEAPLHLSNVMFLARDGKPTRLGFRVDEKGKRVRIARRTGEAV